MHLLRLSSALCLVFASLAGCSSSDPADGVDGVARSASELDVDAIDSIVVGVGFCGGAPGRCYDQRSYEVTFATSSLQTSACVEGQADVKTTRALTGEEAARIRGALASVRVEKAPFDGWDGRMYVLTIRYADGTVREYSPEATCGKERFTKVVAGWDGLWKAVSELRP